MSLVGHARRSGRVHLLMASQSRYGLFRTKSSVLRTKARYIRVGSTVGRGGKGKQISHTHIIRCEASSFIQQGR